MVKGLPVGAQHLHIGQRQEFFIAVQFILHALVAAYMHMSAHQVCGGLNGYRDGNFRDNVCEIFSVLIIFSGHIHLRLSYGMVRGQPRVVNPSGNIRQSVAEMRCASLCIFFNVLKQKLAAGETDLPMPPAVPLRMC
jgi:hypothetical protein